MDIREIARRNDGNYVTEDGTTFVIHKLNPARHNSPDEPMYITEEIPIDKNEGWVAEYQDWQHKWATSDERETDERVGVSGTFVDDEKNAMESLMLLIADNGTNPEVMLGLCDQMEDSEEKMKVVELLLSLKEKLPPEWQELLDKHYGEQMRFSDISREDAETKGVVKTNQAYSKQHKKAIDRLKAGFEKEGYEVDRAPKRKRK